MVKDDISSLITSGIDRAMAAGALPSLVKPEVTVERPARPEHGDYATNVALKLKRVSGGLSPMRIAEIIKQHIPTEDYVAAIEIAQPGFLNFRLSKEWLTSQVAAIIAAGNDYGNVDLGKGERVQVEFVSANPTGPLHVGGARGAALGDALAAILQAAGYYVEREYYINDAGSRMAVWNESVYAAYLDELGKPANFPTDGYDARQYAREIIEADGEKYLDLPPEKALPLLGKLGAELVIKHAKEDLDRLGVRYDVWFHEQSLFESGEVESTMQKLKANGHVANKEGAVWFVSTALGQEKDNVLVRSNGQPTYFISDIAYHYNKFVTRKFSKVINIWGADHQGHIPRMKASMTALGLNADDLTILVYQLVSVKGERMSKRRGNFVLMRELLDAVGPDAMRFNLISRSPEAQMDFDIDLATRQSNENPVYYVQYAHARISSIFKKALEKGIADYSDGDLNLLGNPQELALIRHLTLLPEVIEDAARSYEPHRLPYYAQELAALFHAFYHDNLVVDETNLPLSKARLKLMEAAKITLAKTLGLMGMNAPEEM